MRDTAYMLCGIGAGGVASQWVGYVPTWPMIGLCFAASFVLLIIHEIKVGAHD